MFVERSDIYICMLEYIVWSPTCIVWLATLPERHWEHKIETMQQLVSFMHVCEIMMLHCRNYSPNTMKMHKKH